MKGIWRLVADHPDYRALLAAGLVSRTGDYMLTIGLMYLVYDLTGSTLATAGMLVVSVVPQMLLASPAGVLVDRWDRRRLLAVTLVVHAVALLPLLLVHSDARLWVLYAVACGQAVLELLSVPAEQALVPLVVPRDRLVSANALNAQAGSVARLVGAGLGGIAAAGGGILAVTLLDVASFVAAAGLVALVRRPERAVAPSPEAASAATPWWHEWRAGLRIAAGSRTLRILLVFTVITAVGEGIMGALFAPFVLDVLHGGPRGYGLVVGVQAIGGIAGGLLVAGYGDRLRPARLFGWGAAVFGLVDLTLFLYPLAWAHIGPAVLLMVVVGVPGAAVVAGTTTLLQHATLDVHRGRVLGTVLALQSTGMLLGAVAAGVLPELIGGPTAIIAVIAWQGVGYLVFGVLASTVLVPDDRPLPDGGPSAAPQQREEHRVGAVPVRPELDGPGVPDS